jgi:hypothetical protein
VKSRLVVGDCVVKTTMQRKTCRLGNIEASATSRVAVGVDVEMVEFVVAAVVAYLVVCRVVDLRRVIYVTRDQRKNIDVVVAPAHFVGGSGLGFATAVPKKWNLPKWCYRYCKLLSYPVV